MIEKIIVPICPDCGDNLSIQDSQQASCVQCGYMVQYHPIPHNCCPVCMAPLTYSLEHKQEFCVNSKCPAWRVNKKGWKKDSILEISHILLDKPVKYSFLRNFYIEYRAFCSIWYRPINEKHIQQILTEILEFHGITINERS